MNSLGKAFVVTVALSTVLTMVGCSTQAPGSNLDGGSPTSTPTATPTSVVTVPTESVSPTKTPSKSIEPSKTVETPKTVESPKSATTSTQSNPSRKTYTFETSVDCSKLKCIALTFDDGPGKYTNKLLDILKEKDVKATFFIVGRSISNYPEIVKREHDEGHVVGNHSWTHVSFKKVSNAEVEDEINRTGDAIEKIIGERPVLVRPPYGAITKKTASAGTAFALWSVDTEDWKNRDVAETTKRALDGAFSGAIILMHDIHPTSVEAIPDIIDKLRAKGYTFVTIPELYNGKIVEAARYYSRKEITYR